jgi:hypothetical protein
MVKAVPFSLRSAASRYTDFLITLFFLCYNYSMQFQDNSSTRIDALANEMLMLTRNSLLVNLRFLDAALSRLVFTPLPGSSLATNAREIYYDSRHILNIYKEENTAPARDVLHTIFHCVLGHFVVPAGANASVWNLSCDIASEYALSGLDIPSIVSNKQGRQNRVFEDLANNNVLLTAEKIYKHYLKKKLSDAEIAELRETFEADDHKLWYVEIEPHLAGIWKDIAGRMQVDMETLARKQGGKAGNLMLNLREINREISDYSSFLKKFASRGEGMKLDAEEFDYIIYTYGLQLYDGKVPLIEPMEYRDVKGGKEFVVVIDPTPDFPKDLVRAFLQKTWNELHSTESPFSKIILHLLYPIDKEWRKFKITSQTEFDAFFTQFVVPETADIDFRPAFMHMKELIAMRVFSNLKGLIYFTDGYGPFPKEMPSFPAAFVFVNDDYSIPSVPAWAIRLVFQKDEL